MAVDPPSSPSTEIVPSSASATFTPVGELDTSYIKVWAFKFAGGKAVPDQEIKTS